MFELIRLLEEGRGLVRDKKALASLIAEGIIERDGEEYVVKDRSSLALYLALEGVDERYVSKWLDWRDFEEFVAKIFEEAGFEVRRDVKLLTKGGFQIDVLALDPPELALAIECKRWEKNKTFKEIVREHLERTAKLAEKWHLLFNRCVRRLVPVMVTLSGRKGIYEGVIVVPIRHIRGFTRELDQLSYEAYNFKPICTHR